MKKELNAEGKAEVDSFRVYFKKCQNLTNLLIFIYLACTASFVYYLINFYLKYIPGNTYINTIVATLAEAISALLSGLIVK